MHKLLRTLFILVCLICVVACKYSEIEDIREQLRLHEAELQRLSALVDAANDDVAALRATVEQVQTGGYVTEVLPNEQNGTVVGYTLSFNTGETIYVSTGAKATPRISVKSYNESYYWTIEDEWLLDQDGGMVAVEDGSLTPQLKAEDGNWFVSLDRGASWMAAGLPRSMTASMAARAVRPVYSTSSTRTTTLPLTSKSIFVLLTAAWSPISSRSSR